MKKNQCSAAVRALDCFPGRLLIALSIFSVLPCTGYAAAAGNEPLQPARTALRLLLPSLEGQIDLSLLPQNDGHDAFRISGTTGHIRVAATTNVAALFGVNWYLKYVAHLQISANGDQLKLRGELPAPAETIERAAVYPWRYALNQNTDGYSTPYWGWPRWEREIDVLAASGINAVLVERGMDAVLYRTFRDFGYSDGEIRA
jgi:alpha-N-acetylglucosaminidase